MDEFFFSLKIPLRKDGILPIQTEHACFCQPMSWSMAAMLRDSTVAVVVVVVVVVVVRTRPRAIPLAMIHMRKSIHGFPFVPLYGYGAPLGGLRPPSSAITGTWYFLFHLKTSASTNCHQQWLMLRFHAKKGTQQEKYMYIQSSLSHWTANKKQEGLERSVFKISRNSEEVKLCKEKVIVNLYHEF